MCVSCIGIVAGGTVWSPDLSRPVQRKLVALICCQLIDESGRLKAMKIAKAIGERVANEILFQYQSGTHVSSTLWSAVRARGCQFLGPGWIWMIAMPQ